VTIACKRILLKLSGEALATPDEYGIDPKILDRLAKEIADLVSLGVEVGIVIGGGNLFRGAQLSQAGIGRVTGDQMGMLATIMNALAMRDALERVHLECCVMSAVAVAGIAEQHDIRRAKHYLSLGRVVLFSGGTGSPFFTTDSAASLRAIEIEADLLLKATKVDGVYEADPKLHPDAKRFDTLSYDEVIQRDLRVMDLTAICLCRDQNLPLRVFNMQKAGILRRIIEGANEGTLVRSES
jgi:uridylate kinase